MPMFGNTGVYPIYTCVGLGNTGVGSPNLLKPFKNLKKAKEVLCKPCTKHPNTSKNPLGCSLGLSFCSRDTLPGPFLAVLSLSLSLSLRCLVAAVGCCLLLASAGCWLVLGCCLLVGGWWLPVVGGWEGCWWPVVGGCLVGAGWKAGCGCWFWLLFAAGFCLLAAHCCWEARIVFFLQSPG